MISGEPVRSFARKEGGDLEQIKFCWDKSLSATERDLGSEQEHVTL